MDLLKNPLLPGFYPDPSVCRKGDDYYLVTSTFEYFPGIPVFHSRDFVHWHQIGHALTRKSQANLENLNPSRGIFASTIRYWEKTDRFYIVTTLVGNAPYSENVNFYIWAEHPEGPWSEPVIIKDAPGIDPTLVFDGDTVYYLGNLRPQPEDPSCKKRNIWIQPLNPETGALEGERTILLEDGALRGAAAPEGPHIYHIGDWYYLLIAEGGTDYNHSCTIFRSRSITGPYEGNPRNPLITHRNLRRDYPINSTGHADLIQLGDQSWWALLLASRPDGGSYRNLGRETFAVPVSWEDEWPVFSPDTGHVEFTFPAPDLPACCWEPEPCCDHFDSSSLSLVWNQLRTPDYPLYSLTERPGFLRLYLNRHTLSEVASPAFLGRRQQHMCFAAGTRLCLVPEAPEEAAGMALFYNPDFYYAFLLTSLSENRFCLRIIRRAFGKSEIAAEIPYDGGDVFLRLVVRYQELQHYYKKNGEPWSPLGPKLSCAFLNKEAGGGFTGTYVGMYATSNGRVSSAAADYDWFEYQPLEI